jgi:hypothetical protein
LYLVTGVQTCALPISVATAPREQVVDAQVRFAHELAVAVAPWAVMLPLLLFGWFTGSWLSTGIALVLAGALFFAKQNVRYPGGFTAAPEVAGLLERVDASPVRGLPVEIRGQVIGRGMPGYVLSPDLVVQDRSGFVPLLYRQPIPFARAWFGLFRVQDFMGQEVVARGWYRRTPGPVLELAAVVAADGRRAKAWEWLIRYVAAAVVLAAGLVALLIAVAS